MFPSLTHAPSALAVGMLAGALLAVPSGCGNPADSVETMPQILVRALALAEAGDPAAWELCLQLESGEGRGMCQVDASRLLPDRAAACESIGRDHWRNECWFEFAEDLAELKRWEEAISACRSADSYEADCARHLWWTSLQAGTSEAGVRARLLEAFPAHAAQIERAEQDYRALLAEMERPGWTPPGSPSTAPTGAAADWERRFRDADALDLTTCAGDATCVAAAKKVFEERWKRALERNDEARAALCDGGGSTGARLRSNGHPALEQSLATLRAATCAPPG